MICIKKIETFEVDGEWCRVPDFPPFPVEALFNPAIPTPKGITTEMVMGERFRLPNCKTVCLGMTKEVREVLGIPVKTFENQVLEISRLDMRLRHYQEMGWRDRLRFLFRGRA
jgi:hypothetical protein